MIVEILLVQWLMRLRNKVKDEELLFDPKSTRRYDSLGEGGSMSKRVRQE